MLARRDGETQVVQGDVPFFVCAAAGGGLEVAVVGELDAVGEDRGGVSISEVHHHERDALLVGLHALRCEQ